MNARLGDSERFNITLILRARFHLTTMLENKMNEICLRGNEIHEIGLVEPCCSRVSEEKYCG